MATDKSKLIRKITRQQFYHELIDDEINKLHQPEWDYLENTSKAIKNPLTDIPLIVNTEYVEFTNQNSDVYQDVFVHFSANQIRAGILKELVPKSNAGEKVGMAVARNFTILMIIASYMNDEGKSFPSMRTITEISGLSRSAIGKAVADLSKVEIAGHKLLTVVKERGYRNVDKNVYYFNPKALIEMT